MNLFTAGKRFAAIAAALLVHGINAEDEKTDVAAAIQAKIDEAKAASDVEGAVKSAVDKEREAHASTTAVLREKAAMFDALEKQASESGIDLRAIAAGESLAKTIDSKARDQAKKILGQNAPDNVQVDAAPDAPVSGGKAAQYLKLCEAAEGGDAKACAERDKFFADHSREILPDLSFTD